jgi:hypothetical protein
MRRRKLLVGMAELAVVVAGGVLVLWQRTDRITPGNLSRVSVGNEPG